DGIRDFHVTGVQTCALPISKQLDEAAVAGYRIGQPYIIANIYLHVSHQRLHRLLSEHAHFILKSRLKPEKQGIYENEKKKKMARSEERRVGKEGKSSRAPNR